MSKPKMTLDLNTVEWQPPEHFWINTYPQSSVNDSSQDVDSTVSESAETLYEKLEGWISFADYEGCASDGCVGVNIYTIAAALLSSESLVTIVLFNDDSSGEPAGGITIRFSCKQWAAIFLEELASKLGISTHDPRTEQV